MQNNIIVINDIDVLRNSLETKGIALTLRTVAQAIRLNEESLAQGELVNKKLNKPAILKEYQRVADKLDNMATGLQINIRKMTDAPEGEENAANAPEGS